MYGSYPNKRKIKNRKVSANLSYDENVYTKIKLIADKQHKYINQLIEEGMQYIANKYEMDLPQEYRDK